MPYANRESWLEAANVALRNEFESIGYPLPNVLVSVGFPFGGRSGKLKRIGECHDATSNAGNVAQIFISPTLEDPIEVLETLVHEDVHAAVGNKCGHRGPFRTAALAIGLTGKMTATVAGDALRERLQKLSEVLGPLPHFKLDPSGRKKQGTRMLKAECTFCEYAVRLTRKMIDAHGCPICPGCEDRMEEAS